VGSLEASGRILQHAPVAYAKGSWQKPLTAAELKSKFLDCSARALSQPRAEELFDQLRDLQKLGSIRELSITIN